MTTNPIDSKNAGIRNEKLILSLLHQHDELSQAELRKLTGLNSSTASYIVGRLRDKDLIIEERGTSKRRGAKPVLIKINPNGQHIVGTEININHILIGLFDSKCKLLDTIKIPLGKNHLPNNVLNTLEVNLRGLLSKNDITFDNILGISVALSGSISKSGEIILSSTMGWKNIKLKSILEDRLNCPIHVFSTRVRLFAECNISNTPLPKNILYINVANGVGATVTLNDQILYGASNRACELGHFVMEPNGPICGCGNKGCLEALISGPAIASTIKDAINNNITTSLSANITTTNSTEEVIASWHDACQSKDAFSIKLRNNVAEHLSRAVSIAVNCYDPEIVILAGYVSQVASSYFINEISKRLETDAYDFKSRSIQIIPAQAGEETLVRGGALAILKNYLKVS